ncbi:hypothetical protein AHAS_Ahas09G0167800 [Arachis hypogaea]
MAQEVGDDDRALFLHSAGLQALSCMVQFMGEHSHLSMDLDKNQLAQGFPKESDGGHSLPDISTKNSSSLTRTEMESKLDITKDLTYWLKPCLYNMAKLAKEATIVRRVLQI